MTVALACLAIWLCLAAIAAWAILQAPFGFETEEDGFQYGFPPDEGE